MGLDDTIRHRSYGGEGPGWQNPRQANCMREVEKPGNNYFLRQGPTLKLSILPSRRPLLCPLDCGLSGIAMLSNPFSRSGQFPGQGPLRGSSSVLNSQSY